MLVALNKVDLVEARDNLDRLRETLRGEGFQLFEISAATGEGVPELTNRIAVELREIQVAEAEARKRATEQPKRRVYTIGNVDERAWDVQRTGEDSFLVTGVGIERFTAMTNFDLWEAAERFQRVLEGSGISAELKRQGIQQGDTVTIGSHEMDWGDQAEDGEFVIPESDEDFEDDEVPAEAVLATDDD